MYETPVIFWDGTQDEQELPDFCYIMGRNGLFVYRNHEWATSIAKVDGLPNLNLVDQKCWCRYPKIPIKLFSQVVGWFRDVCEKHGSEAIVLLGWNIKEEKVELIVPKQLATVSVGWIPGRKKQKPIKGHALNVYYMEEDIAVQYPDHKIFGDIHSHANMHAHCSGVDDHDETYKPGIHIVVGQVNLPLMRPMIHSEVVADGARFSLNKREQYLDGKFKEPDHAYPDEWWNQLDVDEAGTSKLLDYGVRPSKWGDWEDDWKDKRDKERQKWGYGR